MNALCDAQWQARLMASMVVFGLFVASVGCSSQGWRELPPDNDIFSGGSDPTETGIVAGPDGLVTFGSSFATNETDTPITLREVLPIDPVNVEVVEFRSYSPRDGMAAPAADSEWPPAGYELEPIEGRLVPPDDSTVQLLAGVKLDPSQTTGSLSGLRVRFEHGGERWQVDLPHALVVRRQ